MSTSIKKTKKSSKPSSKSVSPERIMEITWGFAPPLIVEAAIRNRVFDVLDESPKTLEQLTKATGASPRGLRAILNGLVGIGLLKRRGERYSLAPDAAAFLVAAKPTAFMGGILLHLSKQVIPNWLRLSEIVRTGKPAMSANQVGPGSEFFADFVEDIFGLNYPAARAVADGLVTTSLLKKVRQPISVLDLAAGSGVWGIAMAQKSPRVKVTAVDWPRVIPVTRKVAAKHKLGDRFTYVEGDLLEVNFGEGHRIATLGYILHSEGKVRSRKLLKKVLKALATGGTIVIAEFVPDDSRTAPPTPLIFAVNMLVNTDEGDTFTFQEMKSWLREAGFRNVRKLDAPAPSPLILADKP